MLNNQDLQLMAALADRALALVNNESGMTANDPDLQKAVKEWVEHCQQTGKSLGQSASFHLLKTVFGLSEDELIFAGWLLLQALNPTYSDVFKKLDPQLSNGIPTAELVARLSTTTPAALQALLNGMPQSGLVLWKLIDLEKPDLLDLRYPHDWSVRATKTLIDWVGDTPPLPGPAPALFQLLPKPTLNLTEDQNIHAPEGSALLLSGGFIERRRALVWRMGQRDRRQPVYFLQTPDGPLAHPSAAEWKEALSFLTLHKAVLYWEGAGAALKAQPQVLHLIDEWRQLGTNLVIFGADRIADLPLGLSPVKTHHLELVPLHHEGKEEVWEQVADELLGTNQLDWNTLSRNYNLDYNRVRQTLAWSAETIGGKRKRSEQTIKTNYVSTSPGDLEGLAQRVAQPVTYADLALQAPTQKALTDLEEAFVYRGLPSTERAHGLLAIFAGKHGTGFDQAPQALGAQLGLPVFRVNCRALASEEAGCTDRWLRLFDRARDNTALLWFDQADSLFLTGKAGHHFTNGFLIAQVERTNALGVITTHLWDPTGPLGRAAASMIRFPEFTLTQRIDLINKILRQIGVYLAPNIDLGSLLKKLAVNGTTLTRIVHQAARMALKRPHHGAAVISLADLQTAINYQSR